MEHKLFSIRDAKSETFGPLFNKRTQGEAERDFTTVLNDETSMFGQHPEDFDMYFMGVYDDNTGKIDSLDTPLHCVKGIQLVAKKQQTQPLQSVTQ